MYKALLDIGDYKAGDVVPDHAAELWLSMYAVPPVKKVSKNVEEESVENETKGEVGEPEEGNELLDDYLNRNTHVVKKNLKNDNLDKKTLEGLFKMEKENKKRQAVIKIIEEKLKGVE